MPANMQEIPFDENSPEMIALQKVMEKAKNGEIDEEENKKQFEDQYASQEKANVDPIDVTTAGQSASVDKFSSAIDNSIEESNSIAQAASDLLNKNPEKRKKGDLEKYGVPLGVGASILMALLSKDNNTKRGFGKLAGLVAGIPGAKDKTFKKEKENTLSKQLEALGIKSEALKSKVGLEQTKFGAEQARYQAQTEANAQKFQQLATLREFDLKEADVNNRLTAINLDDENTKARLAQDWNKYIQSENWDREKFQDTMRQQGVVNDMQLQELTHKIEMDRKDYMLKKADYDLKLKQFRSDAAYRKAVMENVKAETELRIAQARKAGTAGQEAFYNVVLNLFKQLGDEENNPDFDSTDFIKQLNAAAALFKLDPNEVPDLTDYLMPLGGGTTTTEAYINSGRLQQP